MEQQSTEEFEVTSPAELVQFLDSVFQNKNEKIGTRTQAASALLQWWFMVETAGFVMEQFSPSEDGD